LADSILARGHSGWGNPYCMDCHDVWTSFPHPEEDWVPPSCVACHGKNGAPQTMHALQTRPACEDCHADVSHVPTFEIPDDCAVCHGPSAPDPQ